MTELPPYVGTALNADFFQFSIATDPNYVRLLLIEEGIPRILRFDVEDAKRIAASFPGEKPEIKKLGTIVKIVRLHSGNADDSRFAVVEYRCEYEYDKKKNNLTRDELDYYMGIAEITLQGPFGKSSLREYFDETQNITAVMYDGSDELVGQIMTYDLPRVKVVEGWW